MYCDLLGRNLRLEKIFRLRKHMINIGKITIEKIQLSRDAVLLLIAIICYFVSPMVIGERPQMPKEEKPPAVVIENVKELPAEIPIRKKHQADSRRRK